VLVELPPEACAVLRDDLEPAATTNGAQVAAAAS
jgi:hypothetical protein